MTITLFLVTKPLRSANPAIGDLEKESLEFLCDGWELPIGTVDHIKGHHGVMSDYRPWLINYFVRFIVNEPHSIPIFLPAGHPGLALLGLHKGDGAFQWPRQFTGEELRNTIVQAVLAHEVHLHTTKLVSSLNIYDKAYAVSDVGFIENTLSKMQSEWRDL
ncbi:hypothetical protein [Magnetospirillum gryphiswaldense]|uniref:Uncharacterized protein n=1 Tax=Magnetospirillum gryphiswaldense TaxID=55518 RepID=A4U316_9PROT|nr:hypothetical protein [Magnetospirillum gryphiswaldense]AVM75793.1 hypothetical protein MSR1_33300 [Magnetospirillum gryphiswaldense MSR-1]AVM79696.1 hypothetical protein MSR1L_33300 [Magnetospirillum gryphiswaldense]CAM77273.1 hypothetical protein MGR_2459 [Magnetospirillum gryphiswaldense MSR-1]